MGNEGEADDFARRARRIPANRWQAAAARATRFHRHPLNSAIREMPPANNRIQVKIAQPAATAIMVARRTPDFAVSFASNSIRAKRAEIRAMSASRQLAGGSVRGLEPADALREVGPMSDERLMRLQGNPS